MIEIQNGTGAIRIERRTFKDNVYVDVRRYYLDKADQELKPTTKGIMIPLDHAAKVAAAITEEGK